ncbi:hypothetical protein F4859DRAFT_355391 [Xylaria cf. heliscus]|nr:hypothetical protein F4859DRAFT_355391 [Xylaria cf. heliscus]
MCHDATHWLSFDTVICLSGITWATQNPLFGLRSLRITNLEKLSSSLYIHLTCLAASWFIFLFFYKKICNSSIGHEFTTPRRVTPYRIKKGDLYVVSLKPIDNLYVPQRFFNP